MGGIRSTLAFSAMLLLAMVLAACGSSSAPSPTPRATAAVATATLTPTAQPSSEAPAATTTLTPTVQPSSEAPARESPAALASRLAEESMTFLTTFTRDLSPRASGTEQERTAAEFLVEEFEAMGYRAKLQPFSFDLISSEALVMTQATEESEEFQSIPLTRSGMGRVSGVLANVGRGFEEDLPPGGLDGRIALIQRGVISFEEKVTRVANAGALAAVVFNNRAGLFRGSLTNEAGIPAIAISGDSGEAILELMAEGNVQAAVSVTQDTITSQNVIAEKPGSSDDSVVVLGGHHDTVPDVPGANDNGSGIATLITVAREVSESTYPFTLRFMGFGSEELGLLGSRSYVESLSAEERADIVAMLNFDALAAGDIMGVVGDSGLVSMVLEYGKEQGFDLERSFVPANASSDHASFQRAGIPVVFFLDQDFSRLHTPEDRLELVDPQSMGTFAAVAIALLDLLAGR